MTQFSQFLMPFVSLLLEMAPALLLGLAVAGVLHAFMPRAFYRNYLAKNDLRSVLMSLLIGIPLPLCSCGVIPTAVGMRKEGASKGATTAFLIGTPQTGVDSIMSTFSVLGLPMAILRPLAALVTGLIGGALTNTLDGRESLSQHEMQSPSQPNDTTNLTLTQRLKEACRYGFSQMLQDIGLWLIIGLVVAGLINVLVPNDFFLSFQDKPLLSILLVLLIACPMYVCATGSIPIAAALMMKGLTPGAALVFLMAGPATNLASIMVLGKTLGRRSLIIYLVAIVVGAIGFGLMADMLLPREWFAIPAEFTQSDNPSRLIQFSWWKTLCAIVLSIMLFRAMIVRFCKKKPAEAVAKAKVYKVTGMMCNHCRAHVEEAIQKTDGVESVIVDLGTGTATVEGNATPQAIIEAVTKCGYQCELKV